MSTIQKGQYTLQSGQEVCFSYLELRKAITIKAHTLGISRQQLMEDIADEIGISFSALKHWIQGHNAPSDIDKVKDLATSLDLTPDTLLIEKEVENMNTGNTIFNTFMPDFASEKDAIRGIYNRMVDFIESFRKVTGTDSDKAQPLTEIFLHLLKVRLDISEETFILLRSFAINYLQQMVLADKLFEFCWAEEDNGPDPLELRKEFDESGNLASVWENPWWESCDVNLYPIYRLNLDSEDALLVAKAIGDDWTALEEGEPFVPFFYFENIIESAHKRLGDILSRYHVG